MKRFNLLYFAIIPIAYLLFQMNTEFGKSTAFFYGFAENKETELSHDQAVLISKILVTPGQEVKEGQLLMEVQQSAIDFKLENISHDLQKLEVIALQQKQEIRDQINQLKIRRTTKVAEIESEIKTLESTIDYNKSLLKDLKSFDGVALEEDTNDPNTIKLNALNESLALITEPIDVEIKQLEQELSTIKTPSVVQQQKLRNEIKYYQNEQNKLAILAPSDGLIGNILCKEGENISSFSTLINFYEQNPTLVKGFVHESLILEVQVGDSLKVSSSLHTSQQITGEVIGLGSRIVEIPERLRKIPDFKTYGREVLIRIPATNPFLQKEKVMLNSFVEESSNPLVRMLAPFYRTNKKEEKQIKNVFSSKAVLK